MSKRSEKRKVKKKLNNNNIKKKIKKSKIRIEKGDGFFNNLSSLFRLNITFKLTLGYTVRLIILLLFFYVGLFFMFTIFMISLGDSEFKDHSTYVEYILSSNISYDDPIILEYSNLNDFEYFIYDEELEIVYFSATTAEKYNSSNIGAHYAISATNFLPSIEIVPYFYNEFYIDASSITVVLKQDNQNLTTLIYKAFPISFLAGFVLIFFAILSTRILTKKHLSPIKTMTDEIQKISSQNLNHRFNISGTKDELKDLGIVFNKMLDDIQLSYEREKQFVSDASHELRTPIAVIKGYAELLNRWGKNDPEILNESIVAIVGETQNMQSLVESLLFIARNDNSLLEMSMEIFSFSDLVNEIIKETNLIDKNHNISSHICRDIYQYGSTDKLKQAIRILLENSSKYTPDNGNLKVSLKESKNHTMLVISDNGIGIAPDDLPHIFDRFYRADKSRTRLDKDKQGGTGLGLSIAKIIIEQHGGKIHVESEVNIGTVFTIFFPKK